MFFKNQNYRVSLRGRAGIEYLENGRTMLIDSEMLVGPEFEMVVYTRSMASWEPPDQNEPVTPGDVERIKANLEREMKRVRIDWE